jgi:alpha-glucosidase
MRLVLGALLLVSAAAAGAQAQVLASPNGRIILELGKTPAGQPTFSLSKSGRQLIGPSALGLGFERYQSLSNGLDAVSSRRRSGEDAYKLLGEYSAVRDPYNELAVSFAESSGAKRRLDIIFRVYDQGIAFRYRLPPQTGLRHLRLAGEITEFVFPEDYGCQAFNVGRYTSNHEGEFDPIRASQMRAHHLFDLPVVCETLPGGTTLAFAEAGLSDYAGLYFAGREVGDLGLQAKLSPRQDDAAIAVQSWVGDNGFESPWRIVMIGDRPGDLIESTLVTSLAPPAQGDYSWVKAGKYAWDWWNGPTLGGKQVPISTDTLKTYIDFAAASGLEYMMIDEGWYRGAGAGGTLLPGANNLETVPTVDLPELVRYAADRKVGLWLWVHWKLLEANMDQALPMYAELGIKGIKVDFMDRDDQQMVAYYHRLLRTAAANKLMVNLHGAFPPRGLNRTYPNFITQEGVFGAEYNKWTRRVTARHNVNLALTRMLLGPMDYTPGGFRNATPETFTIEASTPRVQTTRGHGLAMYVVYDSPFQGVSDSPDNYRGQSGFDFIQAVPAAWDETRVLSAAFGEHVVIARRKGRDWYIGAMTNEQGRTIDVPLTFLGRGRYSATTWTDDWAATQVKRDQQTVTASGKLRLGLAPSGGAAVRVRPN